MHPALRLLGLALWAAVEDNDLTFATLESIGRVELDDIRDVLAIPCSEAVSQFIKLGFVGCDNTDLASQVTTAVVFAESVIHLHSDIQLLGIDQRLTSVASLLDTLNIEETIGAKQRTLVPWLLPKYVHVWTIGKLPFVELVAWEHADFGNCGGKLFGISDENTLAAAVLEWNQRAQLHTLGSFIDNDRLELDIQISEHFVTTTTQSCAQNLQFFFEFCGLLVELVTVGLGLVFGLVALEAGLDHFIQSDIPYSGVDGFASTQSKHIDTLGLSGNRFDTSLHSKHQLIYGRIAGRTNEELF
ncbi:hypothetical protein HG530_002228 [Fusarium avenaceum]|nr:hypothetical protein HG530_002228 [Fusarium avenaceum]